MLFERAAVCNVYAHTENCHKVKQNEQQRNDYHNKVVTKFLIVFFFHHINNEMRCEPVCDNNKQQAHNGNEFCSECNKSIVIHIVEIYFPIYFPIYFLIYFVSLFLMNHSAALTASSLVSHFILPCSS